MANIEHMKKIVPLITCGIPFSQHVCDLVLGVTETDLDFFGSKLTLSNNQSRATLWVRETCLIVGLRPFENHLNHGLIVLKDIQHGTSTRMHCVEWNVVNVCWNDVGVLDWDGVMHVWLDNCRRVSPELFLGLFNLARFGMKYFNHQIPNSVSGNTVHAYTCIKKNYFRFCRAVWNCMFVSCTSNLLEQVYDYRRGKKKLLILILSLQDLQQNQSPETFLICIVVAVFPTWQCCLNSLVWCRRDQTC